MILKSDKTDCFALVKGNMIYPDLKTLAERLKWARKRKELTQMDLAKAANVSRIAIQKIESGATIRPRNIDPIAKLLDVPPAWLLLGNEAATLSEDGIQIAKIWESLPDETKNIIKTMINSVKK